MGRWSSNLAPSLSSIYRFTYCIQVLMRKERKLKNHFPPDLDVFIFQSSKLQLICTTKIKISNQTHKTHRRLHHCTSRQCMKYLSSINVRAIHRCYTWPTWQTRRLVELREKAWGFMNAQNNSYLCNTEAHRSKVTTVLWYKCIYIALQVKPSQDMHNARYICAAAMFW